MRRQMNEQTDERANIWMCRQIDEQTDGMSRQMDEQTDE